MAGTVLRLVSLVSTGLLLTSGMACAGSMFGIAVIGGALRATASGIAAAPLAVGALAINAGTSGFGDGDAFADWPTYLIVDASPVDAQVFLDGRRLGTAGQLVAHALPVIPGSHRLEILAPGFRSYVAAFTSEPGQFPIRVRVALPQQLSSP